MLMYLLKVIISFIWFVYLNLILNDVFLILLISFKMEVLFLVFYLMCYKKGIKIVKMFYFVMMY